MNLALLIANRGFFPSTVIDSAREEMCAAAKRAGVPLIMPEKELTRYGAVETTEEGMAYAEFLEKHRGQYDGLIVCLPNFGDENGIKAALKDVNVPVLLQAYPDEIGKMDFAHRRDAFCGKLGLCAVFKQMGFRFTSGMPFVMHPCSEEFHRALTEFTEICRVVKGMRHVRLGVLGARTTAFKSVRYDESAMERLGCDVEALDMTQIFARVRALEEQDPAIEQWADRISQATDLSDTPAYAVQNLAKLGAALEALIREMHLDAIAIRCWNELQDEYGIAPCVLLGILNQMGIPAACETDATNALPMLALSLAANAPSGCLDINNNYGDAPDKCVLFHCGPLPLDLMEGPGHDEEHKMFVKTRGENCSWGVNVGRIRPGEITIAGCRTENGQVRYFVEDTEITDDAVEEAFFGTSGVLLLKGLQEKLMHMAEEGFRHHSIIVRGHHSRAVSEALSKYLGYTRVLL